MNWGWKRVNEIVRFIGRSADPHAIKIGNEAENLAQAIKFELPHEFKYATVFLHIQFGYYADVVNLGDDRIFKPTRTHTQKPGRYTAYLEVLIDGDVVWKSDVFYLHVGSLPNDGELIEKKYPTAFEEALQAVAALTGIKVEAETLPSGSNATVRLEKTDEGESVLVYGIPTGDKGDVGPSPTISTESVAGGYRLTIENPDGNYEQITVRNGTAPTVRVEKIDGGNRVTITGANGPQSFDVMDGVGGSGGGGVSPTIAVSTITGGHRLTITDANGTKTVDVMNGKDGDDVTSDGVVSALGYTPANVANVVQHTAQTLTEAQKTQARENIGAEKAAAKYELIETVTCDGSYGNLARTGLALKRAKIYIHTTAAAAAASVIAEINNGAGFFGYAWMGNAINTADRWTFINIVSDGDDAYVEFTAAAVQSYNAGAVQRTAGRFDGKTPISRINMYVASSGLFPAGSTIEIWGVRA